MIEIEEVPKEGAVSRLGLASFAAAKLYAVEAVVVGFKRRREGTWAQAQTQAQTQAQAQAQA